MLEQEFLKFGYTKSAYELIMKDSSICRFNEDTLRKHFAYINNFLLKMGYMKDEIIKMIKLFPSLYGYSVDYLQQKIEDLVSLGYSQIEVIKITKTFPSIYSFKKEYIEQKIELLKSFGYTHEEIIKITRKNPIIYGLNVDNIIQKKNTMLSLGYNQEDIFIMFKEMPVLFSLNINSIIKKINDLMSLGYTREQVITMTKKFSTLFCYNISSIKEKLDFYDSIGLHDLAIIDSKQLIQSTRLAYSRYMFYKEKDININMINYRKLFVGRKQFEKQYQVTNEEIMEKYNFQAYLEENNGRTI